MAPEHLKAAAVALALVSLTLLALAAGDWESGGNPDADPPERAGCRGGVILLVVSLLVAGTLWALADSNGWSRDRVFWVGCGAFLCVMTLLRPWWFWENYKARWLRNAIGDAPTVLIYLTLSAAFIWVGLFTDWTFGRH